MGVPDANALILFSRIVAPDVHNFLQWAEGMGQSISPAMHRSLQVSTPEL